ncbi:MAG: MBL fold metallo-hydrolase [Gammaproteobacteria bacterium]|nr:MBL fold metallo-hydrolase [Gammaproteobacteria bacterium]MDH3536716.1 MBL fold metallo-hydrolase [Gammaproteobacteria bacterium]
MAEYAALSHGIYCIDALYIKPQVASIYLLREGDEVAIIETGTCHSLPNLLACLDELGIDKSQVRYVIPTHVHLDHAGGAGAMIRQFEQASLIVHPRGARHMIDPQKLIAGTIGVYGQDKYERLYGNIEPVPEARVTIAEDLERFSLNSRDLVFIDTPGHARHHFCIFDQASNGMFTGDTFGISYAPMKRLARGLIPTTPPTQFDPPALHDSVSRIMSMQPQRLYLTHYGEFANPAAQLASFDRWIDEYVEVCGRAQPGDEPAQRELENALAKITLDGLADSDEPGELARILRMDIRLNAQGLAHWWRSSGHG